MNDEVKHGWYSAQCDKRCGYVIWLTPEGKRVTLTMVNDSSTESKTAWQDAVYVGPVIQFVETHKKDRFFPIS